MRGCPTVMALGGGAGEIQHPHLSCCVHFLLLLTTICISTACAVDKDFIVQIIALLAWLAVLILQMLVPYAARAEP